MIHSLNIGKVVYSLLSPITRNIYPLVAENSTRFPFIVYSRDSLISSYCKDGLYEDEVTLTVNIATAKYDEGVSMAEQVRETLTINKYETDGMKISSVMTNATEAYADTCYVQTLIFDIKINN